MWQKQILNIFRNEFLDKKGARWLHIFLVLIGYQYIDLEISEN